MSRQRLFCLLGVLIFSAAMVWDFSQAGRPQIHEGVYCPESRFDAISAATTKVALVPSDYETLADPVPTDSEPDEECIEAMVREALALQGGIQWIVQPGDKVLIKPNIVDVEPSGTGEITDVRVVKALVKIVNEAIGGEGEIIVGEGSPRETEYELPYSHRQQARWHELWDVAGYADLPADPDLAGIPLRLCNLNGSPPQDPWQDLLLVDVPGGGVAAPQQGNYWVHKEVLDCDVFITVPALKTHKVGLTCALKNQIGIAPSTKYGFSKTGGVPQNDYQFRLVHRADLPRDWVDEEIVDLAAMADIDLVVVDALRPLESGKEAIRDGTGQITNGVRMNTIIAGTDPVAVDHVCARLIGLNPDDINHITLAEKVGLGTNDPDLIHIFGRPVDQLARRLRKDPYFTSDFGQSNRTWILSPPFSTTGLPDPIGHEFIPHEAVASPEAYSQTWSEPTYFFDDRIDLGSYYQDLRDIVSYAFTYLDVPVEQEAELWIGSDEPLRVYLNGRVVYTYGGTRAFNKERLVLDIVPLHLAGGENWLLVKSEQHVSTHDFSLNICTPEPDPDLDGNRVEGLKFYTERRGCEVALELCGVSAGALSAGATDRHVATIFVRCNGPGAAFQAINVRKTGTCALSDIKSIALCRDNGDGLFQSGQDERIGQNIFHAQSTRIRFEDETVSSAGAAYYVVVDVAETLSRQDATFGLEFESAENFEIRDCDAVFAANVPFQTLSIPLPVELVRFAAEPSQHGVLLTWRTLSESNNLQFNIERSRDGAPFQIIGSVSGGGTVREMRDYSYMDPEPPPGELVYRLIQIDRSGSARIASTARLDIAPPDHYALRPNHPNPFNLTTCITFELPREEAIRLSIYAVNGAMVREVVNDVRGAGVHEVFWDGRDSSGNPVASGAYLCTLAAGDFRQSRKMLLIR